MEDAQSFGTWLKQRRKELLLTQSALAELAGCAAITIRKIEADDLRPSPQIAAQLAQHLELTPEERATFITSARTGRRPTSPREQPKGRSAAPPGRPSNLPLPRERLIGRDEDEAAVRELLMRDEVGLVTLTGSGGSGKTRLSLQVAASLLEEFQGEVWIVDLAPLSDPGLVVPSIAHALGVQERGGQLETLKAYLREKRMLLVLDNFEQVAAAAPLVAGLVAAAPQLKALVTSRVVLHVSGEHEYGVAPLAIPDQTDMPLEVLGRYAAIMLFIRRARAVKPDFQMTAATAQAVAEICARLDGLPLAIELAAARVKLFAPATLLQRLAEPLALLRGGARDLPERQQTLRATLDWSYNLLAADEQALFRRLGIFVGGWTLEAAAAVCALEGELQADMTDGLQALLDQSLIKSIEQAGGEPRFSMLETIHGYALERLEMSGERELLGARHAAYYVTLVEAAEPELEGRQQQAWLQRLAAEHDNIRAALRWTCAAPATTDLGLHIVATLDRFWWKRGFLREMRSWLERLLEQGEGSLGARAKAWGALAQAASGLDEFALATRYFQESLARFRELDDRAGIARTLLHQGRNLRHQGDYAQALALGMESLALFQSLQDRRGVGIALMSLGDVALDQGDVERAQMHFAEAKTVGQELGNRDMVAWTNFNLGWAAHRRSDEGQAMLLLTESLAQFRAVDDRSGLPQALQALGYVAHARGAHEKAAGFFKESVPLVVESGSRQELADAFAGLVGVAATTRQPERAARLCGALATLLAAADIRLSPMARDSYERNVAFARAHVDEATWQAAWANGRAMTQEQAVAYALDVERAAPG